MLAHVYIYLIWEVLFTFNEPRIYFLLLTSESKRIHLTKMIKCGRKVTAHILKPVALSRSPLQYTWACQMPLYPWACYPRHRELLQDAEGGTGFQRETGTKQHGQKMPEIHYWYFLPEQLDFEMKAKVGPDYFINYLCNYKSTRLFIFNADLKLHQRTVQSKT